MRSTPQAQYENVRRKKEELRDLVETRWLHRLYLLSIFQGIMVRITPHRAILCLRQYWLFLCLPLPLLPLPLPLLFFTTQLLPTQHNLGPQHLLGLYRFLVSLQCL